MAPFRDQLKNLSTLQKDRGKIKEKKNTKGAWIELPGEENPV